MSIVNLQEWGRVWCPQSCATLHRTDVFLEHSFENAALFFLFFYLFAFLFNVLTFMYAHIIS